MQSAKGLSTRSDLPHDSQKPSELDDRCSAGLYRDSWNWEQTGLVAGAAISVAVGLTAPVQAEDVPAEAVQQPAQLSSDTFIDKAVASTIAIQSLVKPEAMEKARFGIMSESVSVPNLSEEVSSEDQPCKDNLCRGIEFIDAKLPELQHRVQDLRSQMQQFQGQHTAQNLQTHQAILANRGVDIAQQKADIAKQMSDVELQQLELQTLLSMQPYEANFTQDLLAQDARYQDRLQQLREVENQIAVEFSQPELNHTQLDRLYEQYQHITDALYYDALDLMDRFIAISQVQASNPLWQEPMYQDLLQRLMISTHQYQVLVQRQDTIDQIENLLTENRAELTGLLREYTSLQQQLDVQTQVLQNYILRRQTLQAEIERPKFSPQVTSSPQLATISAPSIGHFFIGISPERQRDVALALLMGGGILTALARHQVKDPYFKDYQLSSSQSELVEKDVEVVSEEPLSLASIFEDHTEPDSEVFAAMAIAIVLQTFSPDEQEPAILPVQLFSELSCFSLGPVALPIDDIDLFADDAIDVALNGLDIERTEVLPLPNSFYLEENTDTTDSSNSEKKILIVA